VGAPSLNSHLQSETRVVGPAGFEPTTSAQEQRLAEPYGFLDDRSRTSSSPKRVSKSLNLLLEPVVMAWLDYDPTYQAHT